MSDKNSFEVSMENLSKAVETLQKGELSMDEMMDVFKEGTIAAKQCLSILRATENEMNDISLEIEKLIREEDNRKNDRGLDSTKTEAD